MRRLLRKLPLVRTCRQVSEIVVAREDRTLTARESIVVGLHMAICKACPAFENQIRGIGRAMKKWRNYVDRDGA